MNDAFSSEQGNWIAESKIKYWIYGHSHINIPGQIGRTIFLSNQLGYVFDYPEAISFDSGAAIYEFDEERTYFSATVKIHPEFLRDTESHNVPHENPRLAAILYLLNELHTRE